MKSKSIEFPLFFSIFWSLGHPKILIFPRFFIVLGGGASEKREKKKKLKVSAMAWGTENIDFSVDF